jgi:hypothetical protein
MIRKWAWIREYCKRQGFRRSAEIADQIDRVLCYIYGYVDTEEWREYESKGVDGISETGETDLSEDEVMNNIISRRGFCIGCVIDGICSMEYFCEQCRFNAMTGSWDGHYSLYDEFYKTFGEGM